MVFLNNDSIINNWRDDREKRNEMTEYRVYMYVNEVELILEKDREMKIKYQGQLCDLSHIYSNFYH